MNWRDLATQPHPTIGGCIELMEEGGLVGGDGFRVFRGRIHDVQWHGDLPKFTITDAVEFDRKQGKWEVTPWCRSLSNLDLGEIEMVNGLLNCYQVFGPIIYFNTLVGLTGIIFPTGVQIPLQPAPPPLSPSELLNFCSQSPSK